MIAPLFLIAVAARIYVGSWTLFDLILIVGLVSVQSGTEWVLHRYVLHFGPRPMFGREVDIHPSRAHRRHHENPNDLSTVFVGPIGTVVFLVVLASLCFLLFRTSPLLLTGLCVGMVLLLAYEWTHFLLHTAYEPRRAYYRHLKRAHGFHHFQNEWYWMGITGYAFDKLVGTFKEPDEVPLTELSITARQAVGLPA